MTTIHATVNSAPEYWAQILLPDFADFQAQPADLRKAFHCAISLFHMCDWIFFTYEAQVCAAFSYIDQGATRAVKNEKHLAKALGALCGDFELIRGVANAAKHLRLSSPGQHPDYPRQAGDTRVQSTGYGQGGYSSGPYGGTARVMLQGSAGSDLEFSAIASNVKDMWKRLADQNGWPLP